MSTTPALLHFLPWVRQGFAATGLPQDDAAATLAAAVTLKVEAQITHSEPVRKDIRLYGPGDVTGIDTRQVVRTDPQFYSTKFESNFLTSVEFDRPDFPWMFTPALANTQQRLRPWLCLVVVRQTGGITVTADAERPLPVLEIKTPAKPSEELPDLAESWAWAHGQIAGSIDDLGAVVNGSPERTVSRLLCPRRLQPETSYIACVVPAFNGGRKVGLGLALDDDDLTALRPAWNVQDPTLTSVQLPVYYHWQFTTGPEGDFASLVKRLVTRLPPKGLGIRDMDVRNAGIAFPQIPATSEDAVLGLEGALIPPGAVRKGFTNGVGAAFRSVLRARLEPPATATGDPMVTAPVYGSTYPPIGLVPGDDVTPHWLRELNLDPRYRAVAGIATAVVQREQEALMAAAWAQAGDLERANKILRNAQLVRNASDGIHRKHVKKMPPGTLIAVTRAVHGRVLMQAGRTVDREMALSNTPPATASAAFRRITRPRGPIYRRVLPDAQLTMRPFVEQIAFGHFGMGYHRPPGPFATFEDVEGRFRLSGGIRTPFQPAVSFANLYSLNMATIPPQNAFEVRPPELPGVQVAPLPAGTGTGDSPAAARFRQAVAAHQVLLSRPAVVPAAPPALDMNLATKLLNAVEPGAAIAAAVQPMLSVHGGAYVDNDLESVTAAPVFPRPMYEALRDLSQDLLLPGLEKIEDNTVMLLKANPKFIESFMVGLNHEFGRELLWRNFPASLRETYFRQFWDALPGPDGTEAKDIPAISSWPGTNHLGDTAGTAGEPLVLVIRGELLRRYPNAIIRAVKAVRQDGEPRPALGTEELTPLFYASLKPDLSFFGFRLSEEEARGTGTPASPGWFFVIQEHPTEPRFGVPVETSGANLPGATAAATAVQFLRRPVRIAVHASDLLKEGGL